MFVMTVTVSCMLVWAKAVGFTVRLLQQVFDRLKIVLLDAARDVGTGEVEIPRPVTFVYVQSR